MGPCKDAAWSNLVCAEGSACRRDSATWWQCEPSTPAPGRFCGRFRTVLRGDFCERIWTDEGLTEAEFRALNPGLSCSLYAGQGVCVEPPSGTGLCTEEAGQLFHGGGFEGVGGEADYIAPFPVREVAAASSCSTLCLKSPTCLTYVHSAAERQCFLLSSRFQGTTADPSGNYTSGQCSFRLSGSCSLEYGQRFFADEADGVQPFPTPSPTAPDCAQRCSTTASCVVFVWSSSDRMCRMYSSTFTGSVADNTGAYASGLCQAKLSPDLDAIRPGQCLASGACKDAANGRFRLCLQADGDIVLYDGQRPYWRVGISNRSVSATSPALMAPFSLCLGAASAFAAYDSAGVAYWTPYAPPSDLDPDRAARYVARIQDDGNLVLLDASAAEAWSTRVGDDEMATQFAEYTFHSGMDYVIDTSFEDWLNGTTEFVDVQRDLSNDPSLVKQLCDLDPVRDD
ncbi:hypothetical protein HYH03_003636 [Edaphochlamys debaryana]|uniref:Uncharacterized protein n=1 Tax=Edaphochlamys debaryana TaxID=47281 RepID=A0A835Y8S5_9CHLO|nr:hypothetical protein HYH03_003636 [Edaphochlamys debaryana]|eukprot:KAG2498377.1 hypothetical protein HYH03_003636 [Edaphochlamys debaryana]